MNYKARITGITGLIDGLIKLLISLIVGSSNRRHHMGNMVQFKCDPKTTQDDSVQHTKNLPKNELTFCSTAERRSQECHHQS